MYLLWSDYKEDESNEHSDYKDLSVTEVEIDSIEEPEVHQEQKELQKSHRAGYSKRFWYKYIICVIVSYMYLI